MVESICEICGTRIVKRGRKAARYCSVDCKSEEQRRQKPVNKEWLEQKYLVERMTSPDIAKIVHRNSGRVYQWLRDYGIPTRHRGYGVDSPQRYLPSMLGHHHSDATKERLRQARLMDGHVPYLQNGIPYMRGRFAELHHNWKGGVTPERQSFYCSQEWKDSVKVIWKRDNSICRRCGLDNRIVDRETIRFAIHHIQGFQNRESRANPDYLVLLCTPCHRFVHSRANTSKEFLS